MTFSFHADVWYWRGPAPHYFVTLPQEDSREVKAIAGKVSYGWGMVPVRARIGETDFETAMFEKDGGYILPLKSAVRKSEGIGEGDTIAVIVDV